MLLRRKATVEKNAGSLRIFDPTMKGGGVEYDTITCCHCNAMFAWRPGSGTIRGYCTKCSAFTCGAHPCMECMPIEKRLDLYEAGKIKTL